MYRVTSMIASALIGHFHCARTANLALHFGQVESKKTACINLIEGAGFSVPFGIEILCWD